MRKFVAMLITLLTALALIVPPVSAAEPKLQVDGKPVGIEKTYLVTESGLMLSADAVAVALGGKFTWEQATGKGLFVVPHKQIELTLGKAEAIVNGRSISMPAPAQEKDGQLYLPATFLLMQFPGRLQVGHESMKDAKALDLLSRAFKLNPANQDVQAKMQITLDEPGYFWVTLFGESESKLRGKDMLTTVKLDGPLMIKEQMGMAMKDGQAYLQFGGMWMPIPDQGFAPFETGVLDQMVAKPEQQYEMMLGAAAEVRMGEQRNTSHTTLQDIHLTIDFGALLKGLEPTYGMERDSAGNPLAAPEPDMPELTVERANVTFTIDLKTGQFVQQQIDIAIWVIMPNESSLMGTPLPKGSDMGIRITVQGKSVHTPNNGPILWPAQILESE